MATDLKPWAEYVVLDSGVPGLVGHTVTLVAEYPARPDSLPGFRSVRVFFEGREYHVDAKLKRAVPQTCLCPVYPFPHRRSLKCHENRL